jgi:cysteine desulfurase
MHAAVLDAWHRAAADGWADPASLHSAGRRSGLLLDAARASLAASLSSCALGPPIRPEQVWLASSGEQARDALLVGMPGPLVTSSVDTLAILDVADQRPGSCVVPVDYLGRVDAQECTAACKRSEGGILALQMANAEVGTTQPAIERPARVPWLADATQCIGRIMLPQGWSALWASARDWGGPPGLGIAVIRDPARWRRPDGATRGWLAGSPDVPAAVAAAMALERVTPSWEAEAIRARALVAHLREQVAARVPEVEIVGDPIDRLPHVLTFSVLYVAGEALLTQLDRHGLAVASGSACVAQEQRPSHVLAAMGAFTGGNVRVSLPFGCPEATLARLIEVLPGAVDGLREQLR